MRARIGILVLLVVGLAGCTPVDPAALDAAAERCESASTAGVSLTGCAGPWR